MTSLRELMESRLHNAMYIRTERGHDYWLTSGGAVLKIKVKGESNEKDRVDKTARDCTKGTHQKHRTSRER